MNEDFKVIKIIDNTSLVINGGSTNGIKVGDTFKIYGKGEKIIDPETKENLGQIDIVKATLIVSAVYEKMCVCESRFISNYMTSFMSNSLFSGQKQTLSVDPNEISGAGEKIIKIGDFARHYKKEEIKDRENK